MKLYWSPRSPFVRKVMVVAHETGLAGRIETIRTPVAMTSANPQVMAHNPLNKIPTLITDEGMVLFDSGPICEYLDSLHEGPKLFPTQAMERWPVLRQHALGSGMLEAAILWRSETLRPPGTALPEMLDAFAHKMQASLDRLESDAAGLESSSFTIGHVAVACALAYLDFRFPGLDWRASRPRLSVWFAAAGNRPSMQMTRFIDA